MQWNSALTLQQRDHWFNSQRVLLVCVGFLQSFGSTGQPEQTQNDVHSVFEVVVVVVA